MVENQFDNVQKVLGAFMVPTKTISMKDLEREQALRGYKAVFFPCGMGRPVETSINLLAHGTHIQSVSLRQDYRRMDDSAAGRNIGAFIKGGGYAYFSGYSFSMLQQEFDIFSFFDEFPYQGTAGHIELILKGDLENFAGTQKLAAFAAHSGWAAIRSVKDAEVLAEGSYETPRGKRTGPLIILIRKGKGEALYTALHSDDPSHPVTRFLAMRLVNRALLAKLEREADKWDQRVGTGITDTLLPWEH
ncbi:MAG TPA: hypothetical protein ENN21_08485, partial [Spirochaetes bacterium]|nr:hypothetical protein [Spirochaetota bacterium]